MKIFEHILKLYWLVMLGTIALALWLWRLWGLLLAPVIFLVYALVWEKVLKTVFTGIEHHLISKRRNGPSV